MNWLRQRHPGLGWLILSGGTIMWHFYRSNLIFLSIEHFQSPVKITDQFSVSLITQHFKLAQHFRWPQILAGPTKSMGAVNVLRQVVDAMQDVHPADPSWNSVGKALDMHPDLQEVYLRTVTRDRGTFCDLRGLCYSFTLKFLDGVSSMEIFSHEVDSGLEWLMAKLPVLCNFFHWLVSIARFFFALPGNMPAHTHRDPDS